MKTLPFTRHQNYPITGTYMDRELGTYELTKGSHVKVFQVLHHYGDGLEAHFCVRWGKKGREAHFQSKYLNFRDTAEWIYRRKGKGFQKTSPMPQIWAEVERELLLAVVQVPPSPSDATSTQQESVSSELILQEPRRKM